MGWSPSRIPYGRGVHVSGIGLPDSSARSPRRPGQGNHALGQATCKRCKAAQCLPGTSRVLATLALPPRLAPAAHGQSMQSPCRCTGHAAEPARSTSRQAVGGNTRALSQSVGLTRDRHDAGALVRATAECECYVNSCKPWCARNAAQVLCMGGAAARVLWNVSALRHIPGANQACYAHKQETDRE